MIQIAIKKYKYLIVTFIIILCGSIIIWKYYQKENIYILYNNKVSDCPHTYSSRNIKTYVYCTNETYIFERIEEKSIKFIDNINKLKITSKTDFLKYFNRERVSIFLVIKEKNKYKIVPVKGYQVLS